MIGITLNRAEIEYAVMLAVLNFETEFMKSHYTRATVHIHDTLIEVTLKAAASIPAEDRLAESPQGRALLQHSHADLFHSGQHLLKQRLERDLGLNIDQLFSHLDAVAGTNTVIIKLNESIDHRRDRER
ncbi:MAG: Na-translocating system protein MpsC family protein [Nitrospira sp.]